MKRISIIFSFLVLLSVSAAAQVKIGYYSYEQSLKAMPGYAVMQEDMARLRQQYDAETKRSEEEFNAKYEDFLETLSTLAPSIRRKRQTELQLMIASNVQFRNEAQRLLQQAEENALEPLRLMLNEAIKTIAEEKGLIIVINTDGNNCPFIDPSYAIDINADIEGQWKK